MVDILTSLSGGVQSLATQLAELMRAGVEAVNGLLVKSLEIQGTSLQSILTLDLNYGGPAVNAVWLVLRDICNILFLGVMILIAFGTIFNVVWRNPFYYRSALMNLIVAALLINFSLPIGQTIVWGGNQAMQAIRGVMGTVDLGATVASSLRLSEIVAGKPVIPNDAARIPAAPTAALDLMTPTQRAIAEGWYGSLQGRTATDNIPAGAALTALKQCLESDSGFNTQSSAGITRCFDAARAEFDTTLRTNTANAQSGTTTRLISSPAEIASFWGNIMQGRFALGALTTGTPDLSTELALLFTSLVRGFMLLVLSLSFLCIIVFMVLRIPAVWLLLATSAGAFFLHAWPLAPGALKKWFSNIFGWSVFGPLYLFVIYIGLYLLSKQGSLLVAMAERSASPGDAANLPFVATFGQALFIVLVCAVFMGGAKWAMDTAFGFSREAGALWGKIAGSLGADEKSMFGVSTVSSRLGITPLYQATGQRFIQTGQEISAYARRKAPGVFRTEAESLALRRAQLGVRGGAEEYEKLMKKRIDERKSAVEAPAKERLQALELELSQEVDPVQQARLRDQIKKFKDEDTARLKKLATSGDRDTALAATEALMAEGKLSADELRAATERYARVSPAAQAAFIKRRSEALVKGAGKQKFEDKAGMRFADFYALIGDAKQAEEYYKAAKKGKAKMQVLEAGANLKIEKKANGEAYTFPELAAKEASSFTAEDWLVAEEFFAKKAETSSRTAGKTITSIEEMAAINEEFRDRFARKLLDPKSRAAITLGAKKDGQASRIADAVSFAKTRRAELARQAREEKLFGGRDERQEVAEEKKPEKKEEKEEKK